MHVADHRGVEELDGLVRAERDGKARDRLRVVAMARAGRSTPQIVEALKVPRRTVQRWVAHYNDQDVAGLRHRKGAGAKPRLPADQHERLRARLDAGPTPADGTCSWSRRGGRVTPEQGVRRRPQTRRGLQAVAPDELQLAVPAAAAPQVRPGGAGRF